MLARTALHNGRRRVRGEGRRTAARPRAQTPFRGKRAPGPYGGAASPLPAGHGVAAHCLPSGLSPSVLEFHQVNQPMASAGSRTLTAGSELHRPRSARTLRPIMTRVPRVVDVCPEGGNKSVAGGRSVTSTSRLLSRGRPAPRRTPPATQVVRDNALAVAGEGGVADCPHAFRDPVPRGREAPALGPRWTTPDERP